MSGNVRCSCTHILWFRNAGRGDRGPVHSKHGEGGSPGAALMAQTGNTKTAQHEAGSTQEPATDRAEAPSAAGDDPLRRFSALSGDWFWVQDAQLRLTYMSSRLGEQSGIDLALYLGEVDPRLLAESARHVGEAELRVLDPEPVARKRAEPAQRIVASGRRRLRAVSCWLLRAAGLVLRRFCISRLSH